MEVYFQRTGILFLTGNILTQLDANWQKSSEKVYGLFVLAASPAATPDIVIKACTLVSAIYEDVLPDHFNGLISRVNDVISAGFRHEVTTPFALKAVRAIVDRYIFR